MPGQNPSVVARMQGRGVALHTMLQPVPLNVRIQLPSETQVAAVGQLPSQSSPDSTTPLPHTGGQLLSLIELHPVGQQPSLLTQPEMVPPAMQ